MLPNVKSLLCRTRCRQNPATVFPSGLNVREDQMNDEQEHAKQFMSLLGVDKYVADPSVIDELTSRLAQ